MKIMKKYYEKKQKISIKNYLKKIKIWKENMEEIDIKIWVKKKNKDLKSTKKIIAKLKSYDFGKTVYSSFFNFMNLIVYAFSYTLLNP